MDRDMEAKPYSTEERRVVDYLREITPDIGAGDDPIGFLISSHRVLKDRPPGTDTVDAWEAV